MSAETDIVANGGFPWVHTILSGFIGAAFAISVRVASDYISARKDSAQRLQALLLRIGRPLYFGDKDAFTLVEENYDAILDSCIAHERYFFDPDKKSEFQELWHSLIGHDPMTLARHCHNPPSRGEAERIIERLLKAIGCEHPAQTKD